MIEKILGLSWKQPFANLMLHGKIETRTWKTNYRGLVLICSCKKAYSQKEILECSGYIQYQIILNTLKGEEIKLGYAIAVGRLVDCRPMLPNDENLCFTKYNPKLWCHIYKDVKKIDPFLLKGKLGWINVDNYISKIKYI